MLRSLARYYRIPLLRDLLQQAPASSLLSCNRSAASSMPDDEVKRVAPTEAQELLLNAGYKYLDVRTPEEFAAGHAEGSVNIPLLFRTDAGGMVPNPDFIQQVKEKFPDYEQHIVIGCKAGNRSARACAALAADYSNLADNVGGFDGWLAAKLPVVNK